MRILSAFLTLTLLACVEPPDTASTDEAMTTEEADHGRVDYSLGTTGLFSGGTNMAGSTRLFLIFYGSWTQARKDLYVDFATNLSGSPAANVLTTYFDGGQNLASANFTIKTALDANRSQGTAVTGSAPKAIVENAISKGLLPRDPNAVYMIFPDTSTSMTDKDGVDVCASLFGFHSHYTDASSNSIKYAWIVNREQCKGAPMTGTSPNDDPMVDATVTTVWHEFAEAVSNPDGHGWKAHVIQLDGTVKSEENGDLCEWGHKPDTTAHPQVGASVLDLTYTTANGGFANTHLGARDWMIQNMWQNAERGGCVHRLALARPIAKAGAGAVTGDLDGNGTGDLIWRDSSTNQISVWLLDQNDVATSKVVIGTVSPQLQIEAIADFDKDGKPDILLRDLIGGGLAVWYMNGATIKSAGLLALSISNTAVIKAVGDFDGDGDADLLFEDYADDSFRTWINTPGGAIPNFYALPSFSPALLSQNVESVGTGDFDGDGHADVLWRDEVYGYFYYWVYANNAFQLRFFDATGELGLQRVLGIADVDRDGVADILGVSADGANIAWTKTNGPSLVTTNVLAVPAPEWRYSGATVLVATNRAGILWRNRRSGDVARWALDLGGHFTSSAHIVVGASQRSELQSY